MTLRGVKGVCQPNQADHVGSEQEPDCATIQGSPRQSGRPFKRTCPHTA